MYKHQEASEQQAKQNKTFLPNDDDGVSRRGDAHHTGPERDALSDGGRGATLTTALCAQKVSKRHTREETIKRKRQQQRRRRRRRKESIEVDGIQVEDN